MKEENNNYSVYKHITPDGMVYVGITNSIKDRWYRSLYRCDPFKYWIKQFGWDNIIHEVVFEGLSKDEAAVIEDNLIDIYSSIGKSLNTNRSGKQHSVDDRLFCLLKDSKKMMLKINKNYPEIIKAQLKTKNSKNYKKYKQTNDWVIYRRVSGYNKVRKMQGKLDKIYETPLEAKQKYLDFGYIPDYIKNDDLV